MRTGSALLGGLAVTGCSVFGIRTGAEATPYRVVETLGDLQIRSYPALIAAETTVPGSEPDALNAGFRRVAGYIFGANTARSKISMTVPVVQAAAPVPVAGAPVIVDDPTHPGAWTIQFFLPAGSNLATRPKPEDPAVQLATIPPKTVAVYRYTGLHSPASADAARRELLRLLQGSAWSPIGEPMNWYYDPPWAIPFFRRNEAVVAVDRPLPVAASGTRPAVVTPKVQGTTPNGS